MNAQLVQGGWGETQELADLLVMARLRWKKKKKPNAGCKGSGILRIGGAHWLEPLAWCWNLASDPPSLA